MKRKLYKFCLDGEQSRFSSKWARVWGRERCVIVLSLGTDRCHFHHGYLNLFLRHRSSWHYHLHSGLSFFLFPIAITDLL